MVALEHSRERLKADIIGAAIAAKGQNLGVFAFGLHRRFHAGSNRGAVFKQRVHPRHMP